MQPIEKYSAGQSLNTLIQDKRVLFTGQQGQRLIVTFSLAVTLIGGLAARLLAGWLLGKAAAGYACIGGGLISMIAAVVWSSWWLSRKIDAPPDDSTIDAKI